MNNFQAKSLARLAALNHQTVSALIRLSVDRLIREANKAGGRVPYSPPGEPDAPEEPGMPDEPLFAGKGVK